MFMMKMQWKSFNIDLKTVDAYMKANHSEYAGNQANSALELWFNSEPSDADQAAIQEYWDDLDGRSSEARNYESAEDIQAAIDAAKASAVTKLKALGLTDAEIAALKG
jgi:hypothetical protein